ncbi:hypothetical protein DSL92_01595 [Billgrantia gudaonensis]|uniref:Uncharacterized protein n=1 Tax=Billgrantia gudaonensis TaxID=376427 RepID=A0A432JKL9_9GAMM|nr:hypothetical protein DSL92_01595 [Halomonas gudaonensis]
MERRWVPRTPTPPEAPRPTTSTDRRPRLSPQGAARLSTTTVGGSATMSAGAGKITPPAATSCMAYTFDLLNDPHSPAHHS